MLAPTYSARLSIINNRSFSCNFISINGLFDQSDRIAQKSDIISDVK